MTVENDFHSAASSRRIAKRTDLTAYLADGFLDLVVLNAFLNQADQSVRLGFLGVWQTLWILNPVTLQLHSGFTMPYAIHQYLRVLSITPSRVT